METTRDNNRFMGKKKRRVGFFILMLVSLFVVSAQARTFRNLTDSRKNGWYWPVPNWYHLSRGYNTGNGHAGLDIDASAGSEVRATKAGTVVTVYSGCTNTNGNSNPCTSKGGCSPKKNGGAHSNYYNGCCNWGYGNGIILEHGDGTFSYYAHMKDVTVSYGQRVAQGDLIGHVGSTGNSTGPHLHFAIGADVDQSVAYDNNPNSSDFGLTVTGGASGNSHWSTDKAYLYDKNGISYTKTLTVSATIDLNGFLDGANSGSLGTYGTADVYINGSLVGDDINDYCTSHTQGTNYEIKDIKAKQGYDYLGVRTGSLSGQVSANGTIDIRLNFATQGNLHIQGNLDGITDDSLADYGTFDVYINGVLQADNSISYNQKWPNGTTYEIRNCSAAEGKIYGGIEVYTGVIRSNTESKVVLPFSTRGTATPDWQVGKVVPGNLDKDTLDIEYKYTYTQQARTSPGDGWTKIQDGAVQYENDGAPYYDDNDALATSATLERVGYYYFHYCNNGTTANYYWKDYLPVKHTITMEDAKANFSVQEKGTDGDGSGRKFYYLTHLSGQWAGGIAKCGSNGAQAYYRGGVYQKKKAYQVNTYQKAGDWTSTYDASATSTSVRWRLKGDIETEYKGLQLNFMVNGQSVTSLDGVAGLDVYINGEQKASNATTFRSYFPGEFAYQIEINNIAIDKIYNGIEGGDLNGVVTEKLKTLTLYFETGVKAEENWKEIPATLLPYLDENSEIEYRHTYTQQSRTSPGDEWTLIAQGATQYENDGAQYESDNELSTSATRVLVGYYYFHWCDNGASQNANYYQKSYLPTYHKITMEDVANFTVTEKGTDGDGSGRKWYQLIWKSGQWAGGVATCCTNGTGVYYRGGVYQNKKAYQINTYQKVGDWTTELDTTATSVEYRIRLKHYSVVLNANGGVYNEEDLIKISGQDLILPETVPTLELNSFVAWNTEADGSGVTYRPGSVYSENEAVTLYAQWRPVATINLPEGLTIIEEEAFAGIDAVVVRIPSSCTQIQSRAFLNCSNLRRIYVPETTSSISVDAFDGCLNLLICAPAGSTAIKVAKYNDIPYEEILTEVVN